MKIRGQEETVLSVTYTDPPYPMLRTELGNFAGFYPDEKVRDLATRAKSAIEHLHASTIERLSAEQDRTQLEHKRQIFAVQAALNNTRSDLAEAEKGYREAQARIAELEQMDREAATYVESVICMRTHFTGNPPYVGWKGLGLALTETLDRIECLEGALQFYADKSNYKPVDVYTEDGEFRAWGKQKNFVPDDEGEVARAALQEQG